MELNFENCPYCGQRVLKGALRCVGCGKLLQTQEEREALIQKYKESKKKFDINSLITFVISLLAIGTVFFLLSDHIFKFISDIFGK